MSEFGITKIIDGLFIGDDSLTQDQEFLISNKVSHIISWSALPSQPSHPIKQLHLSKPSIQSLPPEGKDLLAIYEFVQQSRQQYLCCLICSNTQSEAAMIALVFLMKRFLWDLKTAIMFFKFRCDFFSPRVEVVQVLGDFQLYLSHNCNDSQLKTIEFTFQFLSAYQTDDTDELIILNTVKNTILRLHNVPQTKIDYNKRRKRIQWFDKLRPSSSLTTFGSKYAVYHRNSNMKIKKQSVQKVTLKPYEVAFQQVKSQTKIKQAKRSSDIITSNGDFFMDDLQFQSLKQLSRTKFYDSRFKGTLRKRGSLKITSKYQKKQQKQQQNLKQQKSSKQNVQGMQNRMSSSAKKPKVLQANNFFSTIKSMSRVKLNIMTMGNA